MKPAWVLALAILACQPDPSHQADPPAAAPADRAISIRTADSSYPAGATIGFTITNHTGLRYAFNPCTRTIEHESGAEWIALPDSNRVCTMIAWILEPDSARQATTDLPASLGAGSYRITIAFSPEDSAATPVRASSNPFQIE